MTQGRSIRGRERQDRDARDRARRRGKATERAVAARLGGRRVPVSGRTRGDVPDIEHPWLAIEVKARAVLPQWLQVAMEQAELSAAVAHQRGARQKLPIVVIHRHGQRNDDNFIVMRQRSFEEWFGNIVQATEESWIRTP